MTKEKRSPYYRYSSAYDKPAYPFDITPSEHHGIIFVATNLLNKKQYVGKTTAWNPFNWWHGLTNRIVARAVRKYGREVWQLEVIDSAESAEELSRKEILHIARLGTYPPPGGYNLTEGGEGALGYRHTEETKQQLKKAWESRRLRGISDETRARMSRAQLGKKRSPESVARTAAAHRGSWRSDETRAKLKIAWQSRRLKPRALSPYCKRGHLLDGENLYINPTSKARICMACYYIVKGLQIPAKLRKFVEVVRECA